MLKNTSNSAEISHFFDAYNYLWGLEIKFTSDYYGFSNIFQINGRNRQILKVADYSKYCLPTYSLNFINGLQTTKMAI